MADQTFRDAIAAGYVWSGDFTDGPDELTADAVLAMPELQAVRRLIAAALDDWEPSDHWVMNEATDALQAAIAALPGSVRVWATQSETGAR